MNINKNIDIIQKLSINNLLKNYHNNKLLDNTNKKLVKETLFYKLQIFYIDNNKKISQQEQQKNDLINSIKKIEEIINKQTTTNHIFILELIQHRESLIKILLSYDIQKKINLNNDISHKTIENITYDIIERQTKQRTETN